MKRKGLFARMTDLWRGMWGVRVSEMEVQNAEAVYFQAIRERQHHHDELRTAASRLVYLRNRTETQLAQSRADRELVLAALKRAALADDDHKALQLMRKQRELDEAVTRHERDLAQLRGQSDQAKEGLVKLQLAIDTLKRERVTMLARKAHAEAQLRAREAFEQALTAGQGEMSALDNVRESIGRLEAEAGFDEQRQVDGEVSLSELRREAMASSDEAALAALKHELRGRLLPEARVAERSSDNAPIRAVVS